MRRVMRERGGAVGLAARGRSRYRPACTDRNPGPAGGDEIRTIRPDACRSAPNRVKGDQESGQDGAKRPQGAGSAHPQQRAHHQSQIEAGHVHESPLEDVRRPSQVDPSHPAGLEAVCERALQQLPALSQESLSALSSNATTVRIHR